MRFMIGDIAYPTIDLHGLNGAFESLRDLLSTQATKPKHLTDVDLRKLQPFQRALLATDGTVTKFLEAYLIWAKFFTKPITHFSREAGIAILIITIALASWLGYMTLADRWALFADLWTMAVTMIAGSFIAGATAEGDAAIAFPVFTKVLHISSNDARTFGLMIQSVSMSAAAIMIWVRRVKILHGVIGWVSMGGAVGMILGTTLLFDNEQMF